MKLLTCIRLCAALYYDHGFPVRGMPDKCFCADLVPKKTLPPLPITLSLPKPKPAEPERKDERVERTYPEVSE